MDDRDSKVLGIVAADVSETKRAVEDLSARFDDYRVHIEGRLTKVEVRSTFFGGLLGALAGFLGHKITGG